MMVGQVIRSASPLASPGEDPMVADPDKLKNVATEFESLLVAQLLKSMRASTSDGWLGGGEDQAGTTMIEMAEQQLAGVIAASGGLGLGDLIVEGLTEEGASRIRQENIVILADMDVSDG